jgi:ankyrin repeat protein
VRILAQYAPETVSTTVEGKKLITPAFLAAQNGHHETLAVIATVAPNTLGQPRANDNVTPAYQAAFNGHTHCLEIIAQHAADSLQVRNAEKHLPAFVAAQNNHVACIEIIQRFAPATLADSTEGSPAFIAAQLNQLDALRYLLKTVPESFDKLFSGNNPAHVAAAQGHDEAYALLASERPGLLTVENPAGKTPPQLLEAAHAERNAAEARTRKPSAPASNGHAGIVLWGIGFSPDKEMLNTALMTFAQGNMLRMVFLMGSPSETSRLDEKPTEIEAVMYYDRIARRNGWSTGVTPRFQFLGLPDGRKLILAYPPNI